MKYVILSLLFCLTVHADYPPVTSLNNSITVFPVQRIRCNTASGSQSGCLSSSDWNTFNNKLDKSSGNYITNPDFEVNTTGWNLYNDSGNPIPASVVDQDITYTSTLPGSGGNGATVTYNLCGVSYVGPIVSCPSGTAVQVCWYNGPTLSQNPTATVLKASYDATPCAVAIATSAITGTASNLQYETGTVTLGGGGDTSPVDGTGGVTSGVTFTQNTSTPLIGTASGDLGKSASNEQGQGVSTDFVINSVDKNTTLQISFVYSGSAAMILGSSSDVQIFVYDISNAALIPVTPKKTIAGPVSTAKTFVGTFQSTSSSNYRLILHIATTNASAWDLLIDSVTINDQVTPGTTIQVPSVVLKSQPISGAVTDHMVVMWRDSATQWVPATIAGAALPVFGDDKTQMGFATNIIGSVADIYVHGSMSGFSFGPFVGYEQYIDTTAGGISPLPSPFNDMYVMVGMAIASDTLNIQFDTHVDQISNGSGIPVKGGLLTASSVNDGTGDQVLALGTTGQFLMANTALALGIGWTTPVATAPMTYTAATHTWAMPAATNSVNGYFTSTDHTTLSLAAPLASPAFTGTPSLPTGTTGVTQAASNNSTRLATTAYVDTADNLKANLASPTFSGTPSLPTGTTGVTQAAGNSTTALATTAFVTTADNLKANLASPTFSGTPSLPTGTTGVTQAANDSTTKLATTAFVTTADNLKANLASPTFTGDVNSSTGNVLISTIGKGLQVKTGANAKIGTAVLVAGTVTVANTSVTANSRIFLTSNTDGGTPGWLRVSAKTNATSFVITSSSATDTSTVAWIIVESIP